ncbi:Tn3 family transposase [Streptomyces anulatus]
MLLRSAMYSSSREATGAGAGEAGSHRAVGWLRRHRVLLPGVGFRRWPSRSPRCGRSRRRGCPPRWPTRPTGRTVGCGTISSMLLLKRLRFGPHMNTLYTARREVGRGIRAVQLLRYLSDASLRGRVTADGSRTPSRWRATSRTATAGRRTPWSRCCRTGGPARRCPWLSICTTRGRDKR